MTTKPDWKQNEELMSLYISAFCGILCPFPRLEALRAMKDYASEDYIELRKKEFEYYEKKYQAQLEFYRKYNEYIKANE